MKKFIGMIAALCTISAFFAPSSYAAQYYSDSFDYASYSMMSTAWTVTKGTADDIVELRDKTAYLAPGSSTGLAQIVRQCALVDKEIAVEFDLRLENQNTAYAVGVQIFDGESRNFVFISPTLFRTNDNKIRESISTDTSWYTYRTEMSSDGVSWYRKPQGSEDSEYVEIVRNADSKQNNTTAPNIKFFVERTAEQGAYIDNVKLMPLDDSVNLGSHSFVMDSKTDFQTSDFAFTAADAGEVSGSGRAISIKANGSEGVQQAIKNVSASDKYIYEFTCTLNNLSDNKSIGMELSAGSGQGRARIYLYTNKFAFRTGAGVLTAIDCNIGTDKHIIRYEAKKTISGWQYDVYIDGLCFVQDCQMETFGAENAYLKLFAEKDPAADVSISDITLVSGHIGADNSIEEYFFSSNRDLEKYGWKISGSAEAGSGAIEFQSAGGSAQRYLPIEGTQLETQFEMLCRSGGESKVIISNATGTVTVYADGSSLMVNGQRVQPSEAGVWRRYKVIQTAGEYKVYKKTGANSGYELIAKGTAADAQQAGVIIHGADSAVRNLKCTELSGEYAYDMLNRSISYTTYKDADDSVTVIPIESFDACAVQFDYTIGDTDLNAVVENSEYKGEITIKADEITYAAADGNISAKISSVKNKKYTVRIYADASAGTYSMYRREYGSEGEKVIFENVSMPSAGEALRLTVSAGIDNVYAVCMSELAAPEYFYYRGGYSDELAAISGWRIEERGFVGGSQMIMGEELKTASMYFNPLVDTYTAEFDAALSYNEADDNDNIFEIYSGKNLAYLRFLPDKLGIGTANGEVLYDAAHENGRSYTYRIEQSGKWANIVRYDGDNTEVIASGIQLPENGGKAEVKIIAADGSVSADFTNIRISGMLPRKIADSAETTGLGVHFTDGFENAELSETGWTAHTENITIKDNTARLEANGITNPQLLTKPMETIDGLVYRMKYRLDENTRLGFMLLDTQKRVFISIGGSDIFLRDGGETIRRPAMKSETGEWYELRIETTDDGYYSVYRKNAGGEWICFADEVQMQPWTKEKETYVKYFIENSANAAVSIDDIEYFTGAAVTAAETAVGGDEAKAVWTVETAGSLLRPEKNNLILQGIIGLYSETGMENVAIGTIDAENSSLTARLSETVSKVKAMLWDGLNTMKPAAVKEIYISEEETK